MNKRGFTLAELLAIIVILGIILVIAIPKMSSSIDIARTEAFIKNEQESVKAAESFVVQNINSIPRNIGETKEVKLSDLRKSGFINSIINPKDNKKTCNGYVLVTKVADKKYTYIPHINCENDIGSSIEDGLVAHYTFDDFQEPTQNIVANGNFANGVNNWSCTTGGAGMNNYCEIKYEDGEPYLHVHWERVSGSGNSWSNLRNSVTYNVSGVPYTLSCKIRINGQSGESSQIRHAALANDYWTSGRQVWSFSGKTLGKWYDVNLLRTFAASYIDSNSVAQPLKAVFEVYSGNLDAVGKYVDFDIKLIQIEQKDHETPYVTGSRTGTVNDFSINNNNSTLQLASTPKWTSDSVVGKGAYQFNGINNYISIPPMNSPEISVSFWFKRDAKDTVNADSIFGGWQWNPDTQLQQGFDIRFYINSDTLDFPLITQNTSGTKTSKQAFYAFPPNYMGKWYNVVATYEKITGLQKLYINGQLVSTMQHAANNTITPLTAYSDMRIGYSRVNNGYFNGSIDDIKIYTRPLSAAEIKHNYDIESYKINK